MSSPRFEKRFCLSLLICQIFAVASCVILLYLTLVPHHDLNPIIHASSSANISSVDGENDTILVELENAGENSSKTSTKADLSLISLRCGLISNISGNFGVESLDSDSDLDNDGEPSDAGDAKNLSSEENLPCFCEKTSPFQNCSTIIVKLSNGQENVSLALCFDSSSCNNVDSSLLMDELNLNCSIPPNFTNWSGQAVAVPNCSQNDKGRTNNDNDNMDDSTGI